MPGSPSKNGLTNPPTSQEVIDAIAIELTKIGKLTSLFLHSGFAFNH
ncbi:hypothetical protein PENNAL_c0021G01288 [Penicillium nalgiovense]|uniref:Uncharacterized protein n=1 Tax=Penicillium nalgiovense TaxID=60175 RepID=A0A1V6YG28_PENNA|nr:hypothetical protein PENNAL_c0021G01288 [Penicillium nalgiovense]